MTTRSWWGSLASTLRLVAPVAVLVVLVGQLGAGPFVEAVAGVSPPVVLVAVAVTALATLCCAGRWVWTARRLGLELDLRTAVPAYYRSLLLNQTLPGGVLGDVHRAVRQGALRAVAWERAIGQVGMLAAAAVVLVVLPSPVPRALAAGSALGLAVAVAVLVWGRGRSHLLADVGALVVRDVWRPLALSVAAAAGHVAVLLVVVRTTLPDVGVLTALPLVVAVLAASSLPMSLAGWGPREGAAAALFALAGLGAAPGLTVAATYGVLSLLAALPGALLLAGDLLPRRLAVTR